VITESQTARRESPPISDGDDDRLRALPDFSSPPAANRNRASHLKILLAVPTLESGAADTGAIELVRLLTNAGHQAIVVSRGGRLQDEVTSSGGELVLMNVASKNPAMIALCANRLSSFVRRRKCDVIHALGRAPGWSAYIAARINGRPFMTTWHKGFREQNALKRFYNSVMVRGDRIVADSDEIANLIRDRYKTPLSKLSVLPAAIDTTIFDARTVSAARIERMRRLWGVSPQCRIILAPGRMVRRKGHHSIVQGRTSYTGDLWDLIASTETNDVVRLSGLTGDLPAALAASHVAVFASTQAEGTQRTILAAQAMGLPVVASDLSAGSDVVLAPPAIAEDRMTGLRFSAGDSAALSNALMKMLNLSDDVRREIGQRGRSWMTSHHDIKGLAEQKLRLYVELAESRIPRAGVHKSQT
jgi:glycosyltransferase involved in cell wall biosynthesis